MKRILEWDTLNWDLKRTYLRGVFKMGKIKEATREDLEEYLLVLADAPDHEADFIQAERLRHLYIVEHLLEMRISEELHQSAGLRSWIAIGISCVALFVAVWQAWDAHLARASTGRAITTTPPSAIARP